jgi:hypothetical protein
MVEIDVEDGGEAVVPGVFGDGEVEEDHAFGGLAGVDHGFAEERVGGEGFERGKAGVEVDEVVFFDGAGGEYFAIGGGEGGGEVFEEEGEAETIVDAEGGEDVESVLGVVVADDEGVSFEDRMGGVDGGVGDGEIGHRVRSETHEQSNGDAKDQERDEDRDKQIAAGGLCEGELGHVE